MKVTFFISVKGHGSGGHFHSLNHIASAIGKVIDVGIYTIGPGRSGIIEKNIWFKKHLYFNGINILQLRKLVSEEIDKESPDAIHCFDIDVYRIIKLLKLRSLRNIVLNKCGGPNPIDFPHIDKLVVFSSENFNWFRSEAKFKKTNLVLIPNRVDPDSIRFEQFDEYPKSEEYFSFVRIGRIGETYKKSFFDSINLIKTLENLGICCRLYVIGTVESRSIFNELKKYSEKLNVVFITNPPYTENASKMLYLADGVIATGRGVMEATALGLPVLAIERKSDIPVLINGQNFQYFFDTNFSERNTLPNFSKAENLGAIVETIQDRTRRQEISEFSSRLFKEFFDVSGGVEKYLALYKHSHKNLANREDFIEQLKTLYIFYKKSKRIKR